MNNELNYIDLETIDNEKISEILKSFSIDVFIDTDGDVTTNGKNEIYVKADKDLGALRFFSYIRNIPSSESLDKLLSVFNGGSSTVKYQQMTNSIMIEYGFLLSGVINYKLLISTYTHFVAEVAIFKEAINEEIKVE